MTTVWNLLKAYVREFEQKNNVKFTDSAWARIKRLEADILALDAQRIPDHGAIRIHREDGSHIDVDFDDSAM